MTYKNEQYQSNFFLRQSHAIRSRMSFRYLVQVIIWPQHPTTSWESRSSPLYKHRATFELLALHSLPECWGYRHTRIHPVFTGYQRPNRRLCSYWSSTLPTELLPCSKETFLKDYFLIIFMFISNLPACIYVRLWIP